MWNCIKTICYRKQHCKRARKGILDYCIAFSIFHRTPSRKPCEFHMCAYYRFIMNSSKWHKCILLVTCTHTPTCHSSRTLPMIYIYTTLELLHLHIQVYIPYTYIITLTAVIVASLTYQQMTFY